MCEEQLQLISLHKLNKVLAAAEIIIQQPARVDLQLLFN